MLNKEQVKKNFNRSAVSYDKHASTQQMSAKFLVEFLKKNIDPNPQTATQTILDIGAGTGFTTEQILKHYPSAKYLLNDLAPNMLDLALKKLHNHPNVLRLLGDAEVSYFPQVDLTISNLTFQWFNELEKTLLHLWKKTSVLAFSTLVKGTFQEWYDYLDLSLHKYPSVSEMMEMCKKLTPHTCNFHTNAYSLTFDSPIACAKYLKNLGAHAACVQTNHHGLNSLLKANMPIHTSYQVFYAVLTKEQR
jgi:malonyl-CoA O-methyltransferase